MSIQREREIRWQNAEVQWTTLGQKRFGILQLNNDACIDYTISYGFYYRHIWENDCQVHPEHLTYAMRLFVMVAVDILHLLQKITFRYSMTPFIFQKMEPAFLLKYWARRFWRNLCHMILEIFTSEKLQNMTFEMLQWTLIVVGINISRLRRKGRGYSARNKFNDIIFRIFYTFSLERHPRICLLCAPKHQQYGLM